MQRYEVEEDHSKCMRVNGVDRHVDGGLTQIDPMHRR
jgi:hypothetical protein